MSDDYHTDAVYGLMEAEDQLADLQQQTEELWVAIDVGCHECGVGSEPLGIFRSKAEAVDACVERSNDTGNWRDKGQSIPEVFRVILDGDR